VRCKPGAIWEWGCPGTGDVLPAETVRAVVLFGWTWPRRQLAGAEVCGWAASADARNPRSGCLALVAGGAP